MDKSKRRKIILIIAIILIIVGVLLWILRMANIINPALNNNVNKQPEFKPASANIEFDANIKPSISSDELGAINMAKNYAERLGSWSTDQPGKNIKELESLSTNKMVRYLKSMDIDYQQTDYTGVSTKSLSTKTESFSSSEAIVLVSTQRIETKADLSQVVYYQDIRINLVKSKDQWLVDGAFWQEEKT